MMHVYKATQEDQYINHTCCHKAAVIDTVLDQAICECSDLETAEKIATALNKAGAN